LLNMLIVQFQSVHVLTGRLSSAGPVPKLPLKCSNAQIHRYVNTLIANILPKLKPQFI